MALHDCTYCCIHGAGDLSYSPTVYTADDDGATYTWDFDQHTVDYLHSLRAVGVQGKSSHAFDLCE